MVNLHLVLPQFNVTLTAEYFISDKPEQFCHTKERLTVSVKTQESPIDSLQCGNAQDI